MNQKQSFWRRAFEQWKRFGKKMGDLQARFLLASFYFVLLAPFSLILRWSSDPLALKSGTPRGWQTREVKTDQPLEQAMKQF